MRLSILPAAALFFLTLVHVTSAYQDPQTTSPPQGGGRGRQGGAPAGQGQGQGQGQGRGGNSFPQQQRALADEAVLTRGKGLYGSICAACHGIDLRGGQQGGPNLLRSQIVLLDKAG